MTESISIVLVDDEDAFRRNVRMYLDDCGISVREASDGLAALNLVRSEKPDLLVTDLRMPGMDGMELLGCLSDENPELPIIVLSGTTDPAMKDIVKARGATEYLPKPINAMGTLSDLIESLVYKSRKTEF